MRTQVWIATLLATAAAGEPPLPPHLLPWSGAVVDGVGPQPGPARADRLEAEADRMVQARRNPEAEPFLTAARLTREREQGPEAKELVRTLGRQAHLAHRDRDLAKEEGLRRKALDLARKGFPPPDPMRASTLNAYAEVLRRQGWQGRAEPRLRKAWHAIQASVGPFDPDPYEERELPDLGAIQAEREGTALYRKGWWADAERSFMRAERIWARELGPDDPRVIRLRWRLSRIRAKLGKRYADRPFVATASGLRFTDCAF